MYNCTFGPEWGPSVETRYGIRFLRGLDDIVVASPESLERIGNPGDGPHGLSRHERRSAEVSRTILALRVAVLVGAGFTVIVCGAVGYLASRVFDSTGVGVAVAAALAGCFVFLVASRRRDVGR